MAKKQTRKSISVSKEVYTAAMTLMEELDLPLANWTENLMRRELGLPEVVSYVGSNPVGRAARKRWAEEAAAEEDNAPWLQRPEPLVIPEPAPPKAALLGDRLALQKQRVASKEAVDAAERQRAFEEAAWANPCRDPKCPTRGLHPAHKVVVRSKRAPEVDKSGGGDE